MAQRPYPHGARIIKFSASISPSTVSLSNLPQGPVILKLNICLENSSEPITISRPHSCLKFDQKGAISYFSLVQCSTGTGPDRPSVRINHLGAPMTINTDGGNENLMTLYPGKPVEAEIAVGDFKPTSKLATTYICGASLGQLVPGEKYAVKWNPEGIMASWWTTGTKEGVVWKHLGMWNWLRGVKSFKEEESPGDRNYGVKFVAESLPEIMIEC